MTRYLITDDHAADIALEDYLRRKRERDRITEFEDSGFWEDDELKQEEDKHGK